MGGDGTISSGMGQVVETTRTQQARDDKGTGCVGSRDNKAGDEATTKPKQARPFRNGRLGW